MSRTVYTPGMSRIYLSIWSVFPSVSSQSEPFSLGSIGTDRTLKLFMISDGKDDTKAHIV